MEHTVLIPFNELREEDLALGVRVHVVWDPLDNKPEATGTIVELRRSGNQRPYPDGRPVDIVIRLIDEETKQQREASLSDQWIDVIAPR